MAKISRTHHITKKGVVKRKKNQILVVEGDHQVSLKEIPTAIKDGGDEVISIDKSENKWVIKIRKVNE